MLSRRLLFTSCAALGLVACGTADDASTSAPASGSTTGSSSAGGESPAASGKDTGAITVYVPGALAAQVKKLKARYEELGLGTVTFEVGHTPVQREQLVKGARPDVWIAASRPDMETVAGKGALAASEIKPVAQTKLLIIAAPGNPAAITGIGDLAKPGAKLLLAAETLPIWKVTAKTLAKVEKTQPGFSQKVVGNAVSREMGVQLIVQKIGLGVADAGIVFATDVPAQSKVEKIQIADDLNSSLSLLAAPVKAGANQEGATSFMDFITTGEGHELLLEAGWTAGK